jgi:hypothetical protein
MKAHRVQRNPRIEAALAQQLKAYCAARRITETSVFNAALADYFADAKDSTLIMRRLDRNDRAIAAVRQTVDFLAEAFLAFVQTYFTLTPEASPAERELGIRTSRRRLDQLLQDAANRYAAGPRLLDLLPRDTIADPAELATAAATAANPGAPRT